MNRLDRIFNLLRVYTSYIFKRTDCYYHPVRIWIELSSRCNLKCSFCVNKNLPADQKGDMSLGLYKRIIDGIAGKVNDVNLFHRGEPLLNKNIIPMIAYAKKKGVKTRIHTNATPLNKEIARKMILAGLDFISFSFDGYTREIYERNRQGASFNKVLNNIIEFLRVKKQLKVKKPYAVIQVIQDKTELPEKRLDAQKKGFLKNFKGLPLDKIVTRAPHNWGGLLEMKETVNRDKKVISCTFPWYSLTIFYNGKVFLCPQDFEGRICLGDIKESEVAEIFNNEIIKGVRKTFKSGIIDEIIPCRDCDRIRRISFMGVPLEYFGVFIRDHLRK